MSILIDIVEAIVEAAVFAVASVCYGAYLVVRAIVLLPVLIYGGLTITATSDPPNLDVQEADDGR